MVGLQSHDKLFHLYRYIRKFYTEKTQRESEDLEERDFWYVLCLGCKRLMNWGYHGKTHDMAENSQICMGWDFGEAICGDKWCCVRSSRKYYYEKHYDYEYDIPRA